MQIQKNSTSTASSSSMEKQKQNGKGHRLLLMPPPFQGHITPLIHLAQILYSNGFSITIINTTLNSPDPSNYPHFTFHAIPHGLSESEASTTDSIHLMHLINIRCIDPLKEFLAILLAKEHNIACFIADAALYFTQSVCDGFKLPCFVMRTGGASSFVVFASFPLLREKGYFPIQESRLEDPVIELPPLKVKDLPRFETRDPEIFYNLTCSVIDACKASSGLIWNTFEELESSSISKLRQEFRLPIYPIGPFHKHFPPAPSTSCNSILTPDKTCISWLDKKEPKSVVYVSFGSMATITESLFLEIALGLANSDQNFLWVVRPGSVRGSEWLEPLPSGFIESLGGRGYIVKWAPQEEVLGHVAIGAFWTHGGWNSILESVCEGVPMICMPCFGDQKVNAKYVSNVWKVGLQLKSDFGRGEIEKAIRTLMVGDEIEGKVIRECVLSMKEMVNLCLDEGGSSYCSLDGLVSDILLL